MINGFDLDHDLDLWNLKVKCDLDFDNTRDLYPAFLWSNFEIAVSQNGRADWHCAKGVSVGPSLPWQWPFGDQGQVMDLPDSDRGDFTCRRAINSSSLNMFRWCNLYHNVSFAKHFMMPRYCKLTHFDIHQYTNVPFASFPYFINDCGGLIIQVRPIQGQLIISIWN